MRWCFLLFALPAFPQWQSLEFRFQGVGCASCIESLPARLERLRGVESAEVDAKSGTLKLKLAPQNRVRLEIVRDFIEQDGTKAVSAIVSGKGSLERKEGLLFFYLEGQSTSYRVEGLATGAQNHTEGTISDLRPAKGPIVILVKRRSTQ
ncbi:MAG: heavy-metal-associated domain-containing protein [Acidimicrobiia bacterium]|nr:heavy-metal-associated domain-containing protein [Acidimicrobiia bacterium]